MVVRVVSTESFRSWVVLAVSGFGLSRFGHSAPARFCESFWPVFYSIKEFLHSSCFCCYFVEVELSSKSLFCFNLFF